MQTQKFLPVIGAVVVLLIGGMWYLRPHTPKPEVPTETTKVTIAYVPVAQALPLYLALEKGYFQEAGLTVEPVKFEAPNQLIDALIAGTVDMASPSAATGIALISQTKNPGTINIFALNGGFVPDRSDNALLVRDDSTLRTVAELRGKKLGILPGIQFRTVAKHILATEGLDSEKDVTLVELAVPLHLQALQSNQVDAVLTLEPVRTIGLNQKLVKDLVVSPMTTYIANPWYGGGGMMNTAFAEKNPNTTQKVLAVFDRAIDEINEHPDAARQYLVNYTPLSAELAAQVPLPIWKMYNDFTDSDITALQTFFDIFEQYKVINQRVDANTLIYHP
jgi:NitT/TauT family transport system substrate-binding protein